MRTRKKSASKPPSLVYPLPPEVTLTPTAQEDWARLTRLLPLNRGPRLLFVLVDSPVLRRRLSDHLATAFASDGHEVARLELRTASYQPLQDIFTMAESHPQARFFFLHGLERSLISPEHRLSALADLNLHRDQISTRLACPLVIWTTDDTLTDLARHTPDFIAWRNGIFTLADPAVAVEAPYRQHLIDRFGKLTLYSATSDAPLAVDLERVFVKLTATQQRRERLVYVETWEPAEEVPPNVPEAPGSTDTRVFRRPDREVIQESTVRLSLAETLQRNPCLAVIGAPGAGKTTLLHFLALTFARRQAPERLDLEEERLPLFVTLRDLSRFLDDVIPSNTAGYGHPDVLLRFLDAQTQKIAPHLSLPEDFFHERLAHGRCIVLLDGLDEVADPRQRARVAEAVATCTRHYQGNRFVVTSRPRGYEGEAQHQLAGLYASCTIRDFDYTAMMAFAQNWYATVIRDRMGDTPEALAEARRQADDLLRPIRADERVQALAHNPLLLSVLAMVHQRGVGLPQRRTELYDECTDMLLGYWDQTKGGEAARELATYGALTRGEKRALLGPIALWFHERGAQGLEATQEELEREIARQFIDLGDDVDTARSRAALFLRLIDERAGLLGERETGVYAFAHLTFQEYLAARAIADREDYIDYTLRHCMTRGGGRSCCSKLAISAISATTVAALADSPVTCYVQSASLAVGSRRCSSVTSSSRSVASATLVDSAWMMTSAKASSMNSSPSGTQPPTSHNGKKSLPSSPTLCLLWMESVSTKSCSVALTTQTCGRQRWRRWGGWAQRPPLPLRWSV